jgi:hypothetical protein
VVRARRAIREGRRGRPAGGKGGFRRRLRGSAGPGLGALFGTSWAGPFAAVIPVVAGPLGEEGARGGAANFGAPGGPLYRVFPREMTVPAELATRGAYLEISCGPMMRERYGKRSRAVSGENRQWAERDLKEHAAITGRRARWPLPRGR